MLRAILNKSWRQHTTRHQLYGHLPPITKTIQVRRTRHAGHCWRSKDELISDVLLWTPAYSQAKARRPARTYIQQLCEDTGCNPEDLPKAMNDREKWRERVRDIRAGGTTWWWWWYIYYNSICLHLFLICLLINPAVAILGIPLVSVRIEILKPDKVGTFIIVVKCFFKFYPKNGPGELTTLDSSLRLMNNSYLLNW